MFRFYGKKSRSNKLCYSSQVIKTLTYFTLKNNNRNVFFLREFVFDYFVSNNNTK